MRCVVDSSLSSCASSIDSSQRMRIRRSDSSLYSNYLNLSIFRLVLYAMQGDAMQ